MNRLYLNFVWLLVRRDAQIKNRSLHLLKRSYFSFEGLEHQLNMTSEPWIKTSGSHQELNLTSSNNLYYNYNNTDFIRDYYIDVNKTLADAII